MERTFNNLKKFRLVLFGFFLIALLLTGCSNSIATSDLIVNSPTTAYLQSSQTELVDLGLTPTNVIGGFYGDEIDVVVKVEHVNSESVELTAILEFYDSGKGQWVSLSKPETIQTSQEKMISISLPTYENQDQLQSEIRISLWPNDELNSEPLVSSEPTTFIVWDKRFYFEEFNKIRSDANKTSDKVNSVSRICQKKFNSDYASKGDVTKSSLTYCLDEFESAWLGYINAFEIADSQLANLGWPTLVFWEIHDYIKSYGVMINEIYRKEIYEWCLVDVDYQYRYSDGTQERIERCLGVHKVMTSGRTIKMLDDAEDARVALAEKFESLGLGNFLNDEESVQNT